MMMALKAAAQQQPSIPTTVYVEEDFTATTTGDLTTNNLTVDELGGGWLGSHGTTFTYETDGSGLQCTTTAGNRNTVVQTDGREDVRVTGTFVAARGNANGRWQGLILRSNGTQRSSSLNAVLNGYLDADLRRLDDATTIKTWDLSVLLGVTVVAGDHLVIVIDCSGNDITLVSINRNGAGATGINDTYTLTGAVATAHGAGSGAANYGLISNVRLASSGERFEYFKVESN